MSEKDLQAMLVQAAVNSPHADGGGSSEPTSAEGAGSQPGISSLSDATTIAEPSPDQDTPCATCGGFGMVVNVPYDHRSMHRWVPCPSCAPTEPGDAT